ncbi:MAG: ATP-dependent Clp protease proteolytic subunit [Leptospiraceae bacterium]|nr:ATP-dependent Clp protease proteolytic subunit [Leptospiraceae bacterium]MDW7976477.1 ATP-dependent Clp protease proteolytic subunit [Leptospiraceae bacterium]
MYINHDTTSIFEHFVPIKAEIEKNFISKRQIFLWGPIDDRSAQYVVERLLYLDSIDPGKDIYLFINSPGGIITSGMCIYDTMQMIKSDVATVCMGLAASMGALLLCGGTIGKRYAWPHSKIMIHQPLISGQIIAPAVDLKIHAQEIKKTRDELNRIIAERTGRNIEQVEKDTDRDYYMNAQEALEYGIIDKIWNGF